jgi:hypothetical protein
VPVGRRGYSVRWKHEILGEAAGFINAGKERVLFKE